MERCDTCKKKTVSVYACTCRGRFCMKCRMPEDHKCTFDHKQAYKALLELKNPKVVAAKLDPI